jgi:MFS family permease
MVLAVALPDQLPHRRASGFAVVLLGLLGASLMLAAFRVDVPMLSGGIPAWHGWVHGIAFLLIIAMGVLAPLTMALAARRMPAGDQWPSLRRRPVRSSSSSCSCRGVTPHS